MQRIRKFSLLDTSKPFDDMNAYKSKQFTYFYDYIV
jgi:hypothetical protein